VCDEGVQVALVGKGMHFFVDVDAPSPTHRSSAANALISRAISSNAHPPANKRASVSARRTSFMNAPGPGGMQRRTASPSPLAASGGGGGDRDRDRGITPSPRGSIISKVGGGAGGGSGSNAGNLSARGSQFWQEEAHAAQRAPSPPVSAQQVAANATAASSGLTRLELKEETSPTNSHAAAPLAPTAEPRKNGTSATHPSQLHEPALPRKSPSPQNGGSGGEGEPLAVGDGAENKSLIGAEGANAQIPEQAAGAGASTPCCFNLLNRPESVARRIFNAVGMFGIVLTFITVPLLIAVYSLSDSITADDWVFYLIPDLIVDFYFLCRLIMSSRFLAVMSRGELVEDGAEISRIYVCGSSAFAIDLLALCPLDMLYLGYKRLCEAHVLNFCITDVDRDIGVIAWLRVNRLLRGWHFRSWRNDFQSLVRLLVLVCLLLCCWWCSRLLHPLSLIGNHVADEGVCALPQPHGVASDVLLRPLLHGRPLACLHPVLRRKRPSSKQQWYG
jgi:hypothetical protein